jgi:hypothetical protein
MKDTITDEKDADSLSELIRGNGSERISDGSDLYGNTSVQ